MVLPLTFNPKSTMLQRAWRGILFSIDAKNMGLIQKCENMTWFHEEKRTLFRIVP